MLITHTHTSDLREKLDLSEQAKCAMEQARERRKDVPTKENIAKTGQKAANKVREEAQRRTCELFK